MSAGWYIGNAALNFKDQHGNTDNNGVLLSWDRTMTEISDKLWLGGGLPGRRQRVRRGQLRRILGVLQERLALVGYDVYTRKATGGQPTFTTQLDIKSR